MSDEKLVPDFKLKLKGSPIDPKLFECLKWAEVQQSLEKIDMAVLCFDNPSGVVGDNADFDYGNELAVDAGWIGDLGPLFVGEVVSIEPEFPEDAGSPSVIVRAYDKLHRYRREPQTKTFLDQKVSDVIQTLGATEGLKVKVDATQDVIPYLLQNNQSNIDYLQELARRCGFELTLDSTTNELRVTSSPLGDASAATLTWGKNLISFYVKKNLADVPTQVSTCYWDPAKKESVTQTVSSLDSTGPGATTSAHEEAKKAFGDGKVQISGRPCNSPAEAAALASSALADAALGAVKGRGTTYGNHELKPGSVLTLEGLGDLWTGDYYVVGATHVLHRTTGYVTGFEVQRTGT